ncbi:MAG: histidine phosphatase family protein [Myxococcota bacterium]
MNRLILLRHAKSAWDSDAVTDHERPLNPRGRREAPLLGERLRDLGWIPERVVCSDARRARETWSGMARTLGSVPDLHVCPELYLAGPDEVASTMSRQPKSVSTLMLVGHNPGWEDAVQYLTGQTIALKTASAALIEGEGPWADVDHRGAWSLVDVVRGG